MAVGGFCGAQSSVFGVSEAKVADLPTPMAYLLCPASVDAPNDEMSEPTCMERL